jgi:hypothetical protein
MRCSRGLNWGISGTGTSRSSKNIPPARSGPHRLAERHTAVAVEARGNVEGEYRATGTVDGTNGIGGIAARGLCQSGPKHGIDDDLALAQQRVVQRQRRAAAGREIGMRLTGIALEPRDRRRRDHADLQTRGLRKAREHVAIPAIVAATADDDDPVRHGPAGPQITQRGLSGPLHQGVTGYRQRLDGALVQFTHLGSGIDGDWQCHGLIISA